MRPCIWCSCCITGWIDLTYLSCSQIRCGMHDIPVIQIDYQINSQVGLTVGHANKCGTVRGYFTCFNFDRPVLKLTLQTTPT